MNYTKTSEISLKAIKPAIAVETIAGFVLKDDDLNGACFPPQI